MNTKDFYYDLPEELIAQDPLLNRSSSRLMLLNKETGEIEHKHFYNILDYLHRGEGRYRSAGGGAFITSKR